MTALPSTTEPIQLFEDDSPTKNKSERQVVDMVEDLWHQAKSALDIGIDGKRSLREWREKCGQTYLGQHWESQPKKGLQQFTINKTQAASVSQTANQTEQPPRIRLEAIETNEPPLYFLTPGGARKITSAIELQAITSIQIFPEEAEILTAIDDTQQIPESLGEKLLVLTAPFADPATGVVSPALIDESDLIAVTDATATEELQHRFDKVMERANSEYYFTEMALSNSVFGDQAILFDWDFDRHLPRLTLPHYKMAWYDPTCTWVDNASYVGIDQLMPATLAIEQFPQFKDEINAASEEGHLRSGVGVYGASEDRSHQHVDFKVPQVTIRTTWMLRSKRPATPEEAVELLDDPRHDLLLVHDVDEETGDEIGQRFVSSQTQEEIQPGMPGWPSVTYIRQIVTLPEIGRLIEDTESPYPMCPLVWSKNIPIPSSPYGLGEPMRMDDLSCLINRLASIIYNVIFYNQFPQRVIPSSVYEALRKHIGQIHSHPGFDMVIEDSKWEDFFANNRHSSFDVPPPELPAYVVDLFFRLIDLHGQLSGDVDVQQGVAPFAGASGRQTELLQQAARGPQSFKAKYIEWSIQWVAKLVLDALTSSWFPDREWDRYGSKYSGAVQEAFRTRAKSLNYDISVELVSGRGANRAINQEQAMRLFASQAIDTETLLEEMDFKNPKSVIRRLQEQAISSGQSLATPNPEV